MTPWWQVFGWQGFGPVRLHLPPLAVARAVIGAALGLLCAALVLRVTGGGGVTLIAPFGATTFLIFVFPASPLAQPWPVVIGNTLSALAALAVLQLGLPGVAAICLAVALAVLVMALTHALHPPGGAIAIATVLAAPDLSFVLTPVVVGSVALVLAGLLWHRAMGLPYPPRPAR